MSTALLSVKNLCYLSNGPYSFDVHEKSVLGLTGPSGIGKTQMLRALAESIVFTGELRLKESLSTEFSAPMWRKKIGLVPAESAWWCKTVAEHFTSPKGEISINGLLADVGFSRDILSWKISRLSTGEKQRLALVREMMVDPTILLLDEPCSALDKDSVFRVEALIKKFYSRSQKAVIWVSHDLKQLERVATSSYRVLADRLELL